MTSEVVRLATSKLGCPYIWGASGPDEFDCSGLVSWIWRQIGRGEHRFNTMDLALRCVRVADPEPGDLVFYRNRHVMIYAGDGRCVGASGGGSSCRTRQKAAELGAEVHEKPVGYRKDFTGYGRWVG